MDIYRRCHFLLACAILLYFAFFSCSCSCYGQIKFQKIYGGPAADWAYVVCEISSGGYLIGGMTQSYGAGYYDMYLIRTDINGDTIWSRVYGDTYFNKITNMAETSDGGVIITSFSDYDVVLFKINLNGNIIWKHKFGFNQTGGGYSVVETYDGGYALVASNINSGWKAVFIKVDSLGATEWIKQYDGLTNSTTGLALIQTPDSGFVLTGANREVASNSDYDYFIIKTNQIGDTLWTKAFGYAGELDIGYALANYPGGFILAGITTASIGYEGSFLHCFDNSGNSLWSKVYNTGGSGSANLIVPGNQVSNLPDSGYFFTCSHNGVNDLRVYKTDLSGNLEWVRNYFDGPNYYLNSGYGIPAKDGGFIISATLDGWFSTGSYHMVLIKTDSLGWSGCNEDSTILVADPYIPQLQNYNYNIISLTDSIAVIDFDITSGADVWTECTTVGLNNSAVESLTWVYPNPFNSEFMISGLLHQSEITVYDISGKLVLESFIDGENNIIKAGTLKAGSYIVKIASGESVSYHKLLKLEN